MGFNGFGSIHAMVTIDSGSKLSNGNEANNARVVASGCKLERRSEGIITSRVFSLCRDENNLPSGIKLLRGRGNREIKAAIARQKKLNAKLEMALHLNKYDDVEYAIKSGASVNHKDADGITMLILSERGDGYGGYKKISELLLKMGANPNLYGPKGENAGCININNNMGNLLSLFLKYGWNPNVADEQGWYPILLSEFYSDKKSFEILKKAGAKLSVVHLRHGSDLAYYAERNGDIARADEIRKMMEEEKQKGIDSDTQRN